MDSNALPQIPDDRPLWRRILRVALLLESPNLGSNAMLREAAISFFTVALVGIAAFGSDAFRGLLAGQGESVVAGLVGSTAGLVASLVVVIYVGAWLVRDDRAKRAEEQAWRLEQREMHKELLTAIKESHRNGATDGH